ncbi:hypothetical protein RLDS_18270 [Sphingobium lactosutens DS20]|uniref:Uncharacterized protein n=1 Tax=Sphingobium lactosutens DS20 TaxID=1331060 RepID=T0ISR9_9SPHN|nr:hypothetical protein RLDS_18270 [Sphingobium lactosutens DS20]
MSPLTPFKKRLHGTQIVTNPLDCLFQRMSVCPQALRPITCFCRAITMDLLQILWRRKRV